MWVCFLPSLSGKCLDHFYQLGQTSITCVYPSSLVFSEDFRNSFFLITSDSILTVIEVVQVSTIKLCIYTHTTKGVEQKLQQIVSIQCLHQQHIFRNSLWMFCKARRVQQFPVSMEREWKQCDESMHVYWIDGGKIQKIHIP